ncbi:glycosyltransferase [Nocardia vinacea]|uniref:Glycosyltransferase n=1 Tax=Nocardia vinacea TaxID=96468 RepID=A0ABZ1YTB8_9NOCA|nr:glycosyltransferase [Nocardia vinacea]
MTLTEITASQLIPVLHDSFTIGRWRHYMPIGVVGIVVWSLWLYRAVASRFYRPVCNEFRTTTTVVVPSYREDPVILAGCLDSWLEQDPTELIVVVDTADTECIELLNDRAEWDARLRIIEFEHKGKRSALGVGIRRATCEIIVFSDSDTIWEPGLLAAVQMPFEDPQVGGVGTQQNVYQRCSSVWRRIADWLLNLRYYDYVPAMSRRGGVICLSGRTAAYRADAIRPVVQHLEDEFFLGRRCVAGDDGRMTWLTLAQGYRTVHQSSARAMSMFPDTLGAFVKQRVRWSRNSYRCYLTALWKGWIWQTSWVSQLTVLQVLLTPVTMGATLAYMIADQLDSGRAAALAAGWLLLSRSIRGYSHLRRYPGEILLLPVVVIVVICISLPIKLYAFITMNRQGWLTRSNDSVGGDGQSSGTLWKSERMSAAAEPSVPVTD